MPDLSPEAIIAEALDEHDYSIANTGRCICGLKTDNMPAHQSEHVVSRLRDAGHTIVPSALLSELVDPDRCSFDHDGGCQAHGHFPPDENQAWTCPVEDAKNLLAAAASPTAQEEK